MAPRTRAASARGSSKLKKQPASSQMSPLGELETTPTSRISKSSPAAEDVNTAAGVSEGLKAGTAVNRPQPGQVQALPSRDIDEYDNGLDDMDLIDLDDWGDGSALHSKGRSFAWSDAGSNTRRSSPVREGDTLATPWQFGDEDALPPFSSSRTSNDNLPATAPLATDLSEQASGHAEAPLTRVDFSETASTVVRSSPYEPRFGNFVTVPWDFKEGSSVPPPASHDHDLPDTAPLPVGSYPHVDMVDDIYDATPPGSSQKRHGPAVPGAPHSRFGDPTPPRTTQKGSHPPPNAREEVTKSPADVYAALTTEEPPSSMTMRLARPQGPDKPPQQLAAQPTSDEVSLADQVPRSTATETSRNNASVSNSGQKAIGRKQPRQRPKAPLSFDESTQQIKDQPQTTLTPEVKRKPLPKRSRPKKGQPNQKKSAATGKAGASVPKRSPRTTAAPTSKPRKRPAQEQSNAPAKKPKIMTNENSEKALAPEAALANVNEEPAPAATSSPLPSCRDLQVHSSPHTGQVNSHPTESKLPQEKVSPLLVSSDEASSVYIPSSSLSSFVTDNAASHEKRESLTSAPNSKQPKAAEKSQVNAVRNNKSSGNAPTPALGAAAVSMQRLKKAAPKKVVSPVDQDAQARENWSSSQRVPLGTRDVNSLRTKPGKPSFVSYSAKNSQQHSAKSKPGMGVMHSNGGNSEGLTVAKQSLSRNYSVSEKGSPLPVQNVVVDRALEEVDDVDPSASDVESPQLRPRITPFHRTLSSTGDGNAASTSHDARHTVDERREKPETDHAAKAPADSKRRAPPPKARSSAHHQPAGRSAASRGVEKGIRRHLLATFQGKRNSPGSKTDSQRKAARGSLQGTYTGPPDVEPEEDHQVSYQLHNIVKEVVSHLDKKESALSDVADAYYGQTLESVAQIKDRFHMERRTLRASCDKDAARFEHGVHHVADMISAEDQSRRQSVADLGRIVASRRQLYDQAITKLRALQTEMIDGP